MKVNIDEAMRYLGVRGAVPDELRRQTEAAAARLEASLSPRYVYQVFPLEKCGKGIRLAGTETVLTGASSGVMLADCR